LSSNDFGVFPFGNKVVTKAGDFETKVEQFGPFLRKTTTKVGGNLRVTTFKNLLTGAKSVVVEKFINDKIDKVNPTR